MILKHLLIPIALLALCGCTQERQPLGDTIFIENEYHDGKYGGMIVHKTSDCPEIEGGIQPKKLTRFAGWYEITKASEGDFAAKLLADQTHYCPKCLNDAEIKQLDNAFYHPVEIEKK